MTLCHIRAISTNSPTGSAPITPNPITQSPITQKQIIQTQVIQTQINQGMNSLISLLINRVIFKRA
jgi:hypothetical protein